MLKWSVNEVQICNIKSTESFLTLNAPLNSWFSDARGDLAMQKRKPNDFELQL